MSKNTQVIARNDTNGIQSLNKWLESIGVTPITGWRWRRQGWIETVNIAGRQYITDETIADFKRRAAEGEFAKTHKVPGGAR